MFQSNAERLITVGLLDHVRTARRQVQSATIFEMPAMAIENVAYGYAIETADYDLIFLKMRSGLACNFTLKQGSAEPPEIEVDYDSDGILSEIRCNTIIVECTKQLRHEISYLKAAITQAALARKRAT